MKMLILQARNYLNRRAKIARSEVAHLIAGGVLFPLVFLGCAGAPKSNSEISTVEQLLAELDYGFVNGVLDDESFYEKRIGYKLGEFPKDTKPESFSGPALGVGFEMKSGVFRGQKIAVSKEFSSNKRKILRVIFPAPGCFPEWKIPRFFPHDLVYEPSSLMYDVRDPNAPSFHRARKYLASQEQFVGFSIGGRDRCLKEIVVGVVYKEGN
ncbi:hypothetical protein EJP67_10620 [Variovorax guangxiensis]|uniref:Uncharacterized protein n=1 Tax=Variovorax guangxiensis TaxID=1775474 RepID=A0A433MHY0_9BURK|nr:hypothetical protein [Variovorax guangxiensis]RUR67507.1 hypothetical protein EJP67_10620 [Variovorax guangxiensis]